jgi:Uma2 family endonuclease
MATQAKSFYTPEQYLAMERDAPTRNEYIAGEIFATSGASLAHNRISANVSRTLGNALEGRDCDVVGSDMRVHVPATTLYTYPDVVVVCGEPEFADGEYLDTLTNPVAVVEVLSPSTEAYDRGEKFAHYRRLPSLVDYVLVSQNALRVEHFARQPDGSWSLHVAEDAPGASVTLASVGASLTVAEVYRRTGLLPDTD